MNWLDVLKRKRGVRSNRRKPKPVPYNPFTGEGTRNDHNPETESDYVNDRINSYQKEGEERRQKAIDDANKVVHIGRLNRRHGGSGRSRGNKNESRNNSCSMCSIFLAESQQYKTKLNAEDLTYCKDCALVREGEEPGTQFRYNAKGDLIPANNHMKRRPNASSRRGFK